MSEHLPRGACPELLHELLDDPIGVRGSHCQRLDVVTLGPRPRRTERCNRAEHAVDEATGSRRALAERVDRLPHRRVWRHTGHELVGTETQRGPHRCVERVERARRTRRDEVVERALAPDRSVDQVGDERAVARRKIGSTQHLRSRTCEKAPYRPAPARRARRDGSCSVRCAGGSSYGIDDEHAGTTEARQPRCCRHRTFAFRLYLVEVQAARAVTSAASGMSTRPTGTGPAGAAPAWPRSTFTRRPPSTSHAPGRGFRRARSARAPRRAVGDRVGTPQPSACARRSAHLLAGSHRVEHRRQMLDEQPCARSDETSAQLSRGLAGLDRHANGRVHRTGVEPFLDSHETHAGVESPARIARSTGAAPRQRGSSEKWRFTKPCGNASSSATGKELPERHDHADLARRSRDLLDDFDRALRCAHLETEFLAAALTGLGIRSLPRPRRRSGWVTTSATSCPAATNACNGATASPGVRDR